MKNSSGVITIAVRNGHGDASSNPSGQSGPG